MLKTIPRKDWRKPESVETIRLALAADVCYADSNMSANKNPNWKRDLKKAQRASRRAAIERNPDSWDEHKLRKWHWKWGWSIKRIAKEVGMTPLSISQHFKKLDIPIRPGQGKRKRPLNIEPDELREMYIDKRMSMARIAEHYVCADNTVRQYLIKYEIPIRSPSEYNYRQRKHQASLSAKLNKEFDHTCMVCGWDKATCDAHHIIPKFKGGKDKENTILLCPNCHRLAHKGLLQDEDIVRALTKVKEVGRNDQPASEKKS